MLRITEEQTPGKAITLRLEGRLAAQWVELLAASCQQILQDKGDLQLDLAGVSFADHAGAALLRRLRQQQIALHNCSPFLQEQLKQPGPETTN
jgi:ABC-type transporter Mla MlaB component